MDKIIIISALSFIIGGFIIFLLLRPKIKRIKIDNTQLESQRLYLEQGVETLNQTKKEKEQEIAIIVQDYQRQQEKIKELEQQKDNIINQIQQLIVEKEKSYDTNRELDKKSSEILTTISNLEVKKEELIKSIDYLKNQNENTKKQLEKEAKEYYDKELQIVKSKLDSDVKDAERQKEDYKNEYVKEYLTLLEDYANEAMAQIEEYNQKHIQFIQAKTEELEKYDAVIADMRAKAQSAVAANKRAAEIELKQDFYKIDISDSDLEEIKQLRSILPYLRNKEALNKLIWSQYYQKPTTDLCGRVIGSGVHTGIYKITNIQNGMCYVGQSVDLAKRWVQHIKRGLGAEAPTHNKLYPAMIAIGPENFTFEVVEECPKDKLDEREQYWQNFFGAKEYGYSIK